MKSKMQNNFWKTLSVILIVVLVVGAVIVFWKNPALSPNEKFSKYFCTDSDAGANYGTRGTAKLLNSYTDFCRDVPYMNNKSAVIEYSCNSIIEKSSSFFVVISDKEYEIIYKGADKVTALNPKVKFDVLGVGAQEVSMATSIASGATLATLKFAGATLKFTNVSSANKNDANLILLNQEYIVAEGKRYYSHICEEGCFNGACVNSEGIYSEVARMFNLTQ